jgi:hypothetical protein
LNRAVTFGSPQDVHFYFILEGEVVLERGNVELGSMVEGSFMGEAALFDDIKQQDAEGAVTFTTAARVVSEHARVLQLNIHDFYPLVYHEHPGATAIVQRLGRIMVRGLTGGWGVGLGWVGWVGGWTSWGGWELEVGSELKGGSGLTGGRGSPPC